MVEYTVETLAHLYDSLNDQIEKISDTLREYNSISLDPRLADDYKEGLEPERKITLARLEKLSRMRSNIEELFDRILKAEVAE